MNNLTTFKLQDTNLPVPRCWVVLDSLDPDDWYNSLIMASREGQKWAEEGLVAVAEWAIGPEAP